MTWSVSSLFHVLMLFANQIEHYEISNLDTSSSANNYIIFPEYRIYMQLDPRITIVFSKDIFKDHFIKDLLRMVRVVCQGWDKTQWQLQEMQEV